MGRSPLIATHAAAFHTSIDPSPYASTRRTGRVPYPPAGASLGAEHKLARDINDGE